MSEVEAGELLAVGKPAARQPIDIEALLQWAIGQSGHLPWRGVSARELMFDYGFTVIPKGCRREFRGGGTLLSRAIDDDAAVVVEAVKALEGGIAGVVIACARKGIRPDWMEGIEPRLVPRLAYPKKRGKKKHRRAVTMEWKPCHPQVICAARDVYRRWHAALAALAVELDGALIGWRIKGLAAVPEPWAISGEKAA